MDEVITVIGQVLDLAKAHAWIPIASVVIGAILRCSKSDVTWSFLARFNIPASVRPWAAVALGVVSGVLEAVVGGANWPTALIGGLVSALTAISGHQLLIESARGGREIGASKDGGSGGGGGSTGTNSKQPSSYSARMVGFALAAVMLCGCAGWQKQAKSVLDDVVVVAQDGAMILNAIRGVADLFFLAHPDVEAQAHVEKLLSDADIALDLALQTADGARELDAKQADAAFAEFRRAYTDLCVLLKRLGISGPAAENHLSLYRGNAWREHQPIAMRRAVGGI